ncbi:hypothetical protein ACNAW0_18100 [Micromonospora sp. SL1-18]|uniref:hypothetical protein n=1 Tax=Micromonospora sp. SL1-18 TaxID=3399128 RepID=UPI003A4E095D
MSGTGALTRELPAHAALERWYRRLLRIYPIGYRRAYGDEIVATLMDAAEPGRRRPAGADVADLVRGALRQWFRLPVGVSPIAAAVLASVILGAIGAASGSWVAWQTAADLPSDAAAGRIGATVTGTALPASTIDRHDGMGETWRTVALAYEPRLTGWSLEDAQARLRADGWTPGRVQQTQPHAYANDKRLDGIYQVFEATRDGHTLRGYALTITTPGHAGTHLLIGIGPAEPGWAPVAAALGWLAAAMTGWTLTGWVAYRLRHRTLSRRLAALALGLTAVGLAAHPTIGLYETLGTLAFADIDIYGIAPPYRWVVATPAAWLVTATLVAGAGIGLLATTGRGRSSAHPAPVA